MTTINIPLINEVLSENLSFVLELIGELFDRKENSRTIFKSVDIAIATLLMSVLNISTEAIQMIDDIASADTLLNYHCKEKALELGHIINQLLKRQLLKVTFTRGVTYQLAIDVTENPFYGKKKQFTGDRKKKQARNKPFLKISDDSPSDERSSLSSIFLSINTFSDNKKNS